MVEIKKEFWDKMSKEAIKERQLKEDLQDLGDYYRDCSDSHYLKITDFIPKKRKKLNKDFLSSILLYVHKFFENESKTRPDISKFYLPLPV